MQYTIFTDGASRGNPGPGGYGAIISDGETVTEVGGREMDTTNNRMEMTAVIRALQTAAKNAESKSTDSKTSIDIYTDSAYVINGITKWVHDWQKNNWQTKAKEDVLNVDLWQELLRSVSDVHFHEDGFTGLHENVTWHRVSGHSGIPANERCDVIATSFADGRPVRLFHSGLHDYSIDLTVSGSSVAGLEKKAKMTVRKSGSNKSPAYSYVSAVGGIVQTHQTWAECEARVKGVSGARFKKAISAADEAEIIQSFS